MKGLTTRRGSALLIVLGMVAFIVISAVAFSAYMRHARLPSSYLRRTSASRLLVKGALAEAIDIIDASIGNNPHPGVGNREYSYPRAGGVRASRNHFVDHCYLGTNGFAQVSDTVSTLGVEALAYIPPPLINEARYYSRRSFAAMWHTLGFDSGRFAFFALDVSDYFDVNKLYASYGRNSSDEGRISLAHCFENAQHNDYGSLDPEAWDEFMDKYRRTHDEMLQGTQDSSKFPLVSVADLNLAINKEKPGGLTSPFCEYVMQGTKFVEDDSGADAALKRGLTFVTDGITALPQTNATEAIDLSRAEDQPFAGFGEDTPDKNDASIDDVMNFGTSKFLSRYMKELQAPEVAQLYDYLDRDSLPLSLALPTVERTPMIVGVALDAPAPLQFDVAVSDTSTVTIPSQNPGVTPPTYKKKTCYKLSLSGELAVNVGVVYPFNHYRGRESAFKVQAAATVAFVDQSASRSLRIAGAKNPAVFDRGSWQPSRQSPSASKYDSENAAGVITMLSDVKSISLSQKNVVSEETAMPQDDILLEFGAINVELAGEIPPSADLPGSASDTATLRVIEECDSQGTPTGAAATEDIGWFPSNGELNGVLDQAGVSGKKIVPVVQVWVRVLNENDKVVDLVPACAADDETPSELLRDASGSSSRGALRFFCGQAAGAAGNAAVELSKTAFEGYQTTKPEAATLYPAAYLADDPRFNYAPENLKALATIDKLFKELWLAENRSGERDGDIFMSVSDAGYLQSGFELGAILRISGMEGGGDGFGTLNGAYNGEIRTDFASCPADSSMWRTYSTFAKNGAQSDIAKLNISSGSRGARVNPYTTDTSIMMAALANTPVDWWAASTNDVEDVKKDMLDNLDEANKYTYSAIGSKTSPGYEVKYEKLREVGEKIKSAMRSGDSWEMAFDDLDWDSNDPATLLGVELGGSVNLTAADKKYLHAFWRESFGIRQQLFLVFVRAEPMMMGGGGVKQTPPQLGARAVALVWRDPNPTREDTDGGDPRPHRTRVLFYRQFD